MPWRFLDVLMVKNIRTSRTSDGSSSTMLFGVVENGRLFVNLTTRTYSKLFCSGFKNVDPWIVKLKKDKEVPVILLP